jgi:hypothetical protein
LLLAAYSDYQRLHQIESEIRALYPTYLEEISRIDKDSAWEKHCVFQDTYGKLLDDFVIGPLDKLIEEWFGLKISR